MVRFLEEYGEIYFNDVASLAKSWMPNFIGTEKVSFKNLEIHLSLKDTREHLKKQILNFPVESNLASGSARRGPLLTALKEISKSELYIYTSSVEENVSEKLPESAVIRFLVSSVFRTLHQSVYPYIYTFPIERTGYMLDRLPLSNVKMERETVKPKNLSQQEQRTKSFPWYIMSFVGMILELTEGSISKREQDANIDTMIKEFINLTKILEQQILNGRVDFSQPEPDLRREILFQPTQDVSLEFSVASSMVKELSPLVLYLRYIARPGELLIIDEPEMNLHPEAQAKMIEFLAMLVNAGLNVLFTTHSPYITDHLTNLIKANENEDKEAIKDNFFLKRTDAFIAREKVAVYGFGDGTAKNVLDEEGFIDLNTFGEVSDRISNIYFAL